MKPFLFWVLDRLILILALLYVIVDTTLSTYEKCILLAVIGNMVVLKNIKDGLRSNSKIANKYKSGSVRNNNEEL